VRSTGEGVVAADEKMHRLQVRGDVPELLVQRSPDTAEARVDGSAGEGAVRRSEPVRGEDLDVHVLDGPVERLEQIDGP
jgi:hypothetical protein